MESVSRTPDHSNRCGEMRRAENQAWIHMVCLITEHFTFLGIKKKKSVPDCEIPDHDF